MAIRVFLRIFGPNLFRLGNGVIAAAREGVAAGDAFNGKPASPPGTMHAQCGEGIGGATGGKTAGGSEDG
jgi:hypothetical protein